MHQSGEVQVEPSRPRSVFIIASKPFLIFLSTSNLDQNILPKVILASKLHQNILLKGSIEVSGAILGLSQHGMSFTGENIKMSFTDEKRSQRDQDISYYSSFLSRVVLAALMGVGVVAHVYLNTPSPKWLIYMTDQVRVFLKSWEKLFPGHHLVSYPLCSPCIAGPLGKVQVVVELILWLQSLFQTTKIERSDPSFPLQALLGS